MIFEYLSHGAKKRKENNLMGMSSMQLINMLNMQKDS